MNPFDFLPNGLNEPEANPNIPENEEQAFVRAACGCASYIMILLLLALLCLLSGCTTTRTVNNDTTHLSREALMQMDSIISSRMVIRQDSSFRESVLRQLQSIVEKSDTSHTIVTNAEGDTIRERIVINNVREVTSETERHEREVIMHRLETIDSTLTAMRSQMQHTDSLVDNKETLVEIPAKFTYWQRLRMQTGDIALIALALLLGYGIFKLYRRIKP